MCFNKWTASSPPSWGSNVQTMEHWIEKVNLGYSLDHGGYSFDIPGEETEAGRVLAALPVIVWEDPDLDYMGLCDLVPRDQRYGSLAVLVFAPNTGHFARQEFPETLPYDDDDYEDRKVAEGWLRSSEHQCDCFGRWVPLTDLELIGEPELGPRGFIPQSDPPVPAWFDFNAHGTETEPFSGCNRCEGHGYIDSPGGEWAFYCLVERKKSDLEKIVEASESGDYDEEAMNELHADYDDDSNAVDDVLPVVGRRVRS
jgi:hypothetical protein